MEINNYKQIGKGCLMGKFDICIQEWGGLTIHDCVLFQKENKRWITLPSKEFLSKEGQKKHFGLIKFNPEVFKKLEKSALELIDKIVVAELPKTEQNNSNSSLPF